jgi:hypothetical protein
MRAHSREKRRFDLLASVSACLVEIEDLDEVRALASQLLVADGVDM